jgi:hypothetical protein
MNDIVTRLREIDGFGWQCGKPLKDKGTYLRCGCGCSQPADGMEDGMTVSRPAILGEAADEIEHLRAERDEARREVCRDEAYRMDPLYVHLTPQGVAEHRGWDCYKEETDGR